MDEVARAARVDVVVLVVALDVVGAAVGAGVPERDGARRRPVRIGAAGPRDVAVVADDHVLGGVAEDRVAAVGLSGRALRAADDVVLVGVAVDDVAVAAAGGVQRVAGPSGEVEVGVDGARAGWRRRRAAAPASCCRCPRSCRRRCRRASGRRRRRRASRRRRCRRTSRRCRRRRPSCRCRGRRACSRCRALPCMTSSRVLAVHLVVVGVAVSSCRPPMPPRISSSLALPFIVSTPPWPHMKSSPVPPCIVSFSSKVASEHDATVFGRRRASACRRRRACSRGRSRRGACRLGTGSPPASCRCRR